MKKSLSTLLLCFFISLSVSAQSKKEKAYIATLDSLNYYLQFCGAPGKPLKIVSYYHPEVPEELPGDEGGDTLVNTYYLNRYNGRKDCIFILDHYNFLVIFLKDIDTNYVKEGRNGIRLVAPENNQQTTALLMCNVVREQNGRGGNYAKEYAINYANGIAPAEHKRKLMYFFKEAIRQSRKI